MDHNEQKNSSPSSVSRHGKEPFSRFFTRIAGIATAISVAILLTDIMPKEINVYAGMVLRYAVGSWLLFVAAPHVVRFVWKNKERLGQSLRRTKKLSPRIIAENISGRDREIINPPAEIRQQESEHIKFNFPLPPPFDQLPINPRPIPSGVLTRETANARISTALQLAGFTIDSDLEILSIEVGPTLQTVAIRLPQKIQLSQLVRKKEDLANHLGQHSGFDITASSFQSAASFVIPNEDRAFVYMRDIAPAFIKFAEGAQVPMMLGKDTKGNPKFIDLAQAPHLLVAGTTGSGKSVAVNTALASLISVRSPKQLRLLLLDPKMVEFGAFNGIPHLLEPTITDFKRVSRALNKLTVEMDKRYETFAKCNVRNISQYNRKMKQEGKHESVMPYIVVATDEFADLMVVIGAELEDAVTRIAQKARACGIHIILATQRPSVDVVTGVLKANIPSRIAFRLQSGHDFRTVMDIGGPDLLGNGDGVCMFNGGGQERFQSAAISIDDDESVNFIEILKTHWNSDSSSDESWSTMDDELRQSPPAGQAVFDFTEDNSQGNGKPLETQDADDDQVLDEYEAFVEKVRKAGGFSATLNDDIIKADLATARIHVARMVREGLLGDFDSATKMRPYMSNENSESENDDQSNLVDQIKEYICMTGSTKSDEIRDAFRIRKEMVLFVLRKLADEGFLNPPTSPRVGYSIAWDQEKIESYLNSKDVEKEEQIF